MEQVGTEAARRLTLVSAPGGPPGQAALRPAGSRHAPPRRILPWSAQAAVRLVGEPPRAAQVDFALVGDGRCLGGRGTDRATTADLASFDGCSHCLAREGLRIGLHGVIPFT